MKYNQLSQYNGINISILLILMNNYLEKLCKTTVETRSCGERDNGFSISVRPCTIEAAPPNLWISCRYTLEKRRAIMEKIKTLCSNHTKNRLPELQMDQCRPSQADFPITRYDTEWASWYGHAVSEAWCWDSRRTSTVSPMDDEDQPARLHAAWWHCKLNLKNETFKHCLWNTKFQMHVEKFKWAPTPKGK